MSQGFDTLLSKLQSETLTSVEAQQIGVGGLTVLESKALLKGMAQQASGVGILDTPEIIHGSTLTLVITSGSSVAGYAFTAIPPSQFMTLFTLQGLSIGDTVTDIGDYAFAGCSGLSGDLTIPDSVTSIGDGSFNNCAGFNRSLRLSASVTSIGDYAFNGCTGFTGDLTIPDSVTSIGSYAFKSCAGFNGGLSIGNSLESIGSYAFSNCSGLSGDLTIPDSVTSIGSYAFVGCSGFTGDLTIPESVTSIGSYAFNSCSGLTNVNCHTTRVVMDAFSCLTGTAVTTLHAEAGKGWTAGADVIGGKPLTVIIDL